MNSVAATEADPMPDDGSSPLRVAALHVHPVKSCRGLSVPQALLTDTGLAGDRQWMVVDEQGVFVTQREEPRLALVAASRRQGPGDETLLLQAPGQPDMALPWAPGGPRVPVRVWNDGIEAHAAGALADAWLSAWLGRPVRLVRFDPAVRRLSNPRWTGDAQAFNAFSDGFPILVVSAAALDDLNRRLQAQGKPAVAMERFRPNLVLDGVEAHAEDGFDELHIDTPEGPVVLRLVKPCPRCPIPNVDPLTAERGTEPGDTLASYRADPRLDGAVTFGMNAIVIEGMGRTLAVGQTGRGTVRF